MYSNCRCSEFFFAVYQFVGGLIFCGTGGDEWIVVFCLVIEICFVMMALGIRYTPHLDSLYMA